MLYFDSCHNLNGCFPILVFMHCTFVVQFWIEVFNDIVIMTSSKVDVIYAKFVSLIDASKGNFACLYFELQHPP